MMGNKYSCRSDFSPQLNYRSNFATDTFKTQVLYVGNKLHKICPISGRILPIDTTIEGVYNMYINMVFNNTDNNFILTRKIYAYDSISVKVIVGDIIDNKFINPITRRQEPITDATTKYHLIVDQTFSRKYTITKMSIKSIKDK